MTILTVGLRVTPETENRDASSSACRETSVMRLGTLCPFVLGQSINQETAIRAFAPKSPGEPNDALSCPARSLRGCIAPAAT
jgi:hypothetical protein